MAGKANPLGKKLCATFAVAGRTAKHTPGPWAVDQCSAPVYGSDGSLVAEGIGIGAQSTHIGTVYGKNSSHNAHLIAAAPAMYEALQDIVEGLTDEITHMVEGSKPDTARLDYLANKAGLALAQAEGRQ